MRIYIKENIICAKIDTYTPTIYTMNICILLCIVWGGYEMRRTINLAVIAALIITGASAEDVYKRQVFVSKYLQEEC